MNIVGPINTGAATGGAGAATANAITTAIVKGYVVGICVRYNGSPPATTDVVVRTHGEAAPQLALLTLTNGNTDGWRFPRVQVQDTAGVNIAATYDWPPINDRVNVSIAQANDNNSADVWLLLGD